MVAFIDHGTGFLEFAPNFFAKVLGHGADFAPFAMEALHSLKGHDDVRLVGESLGFFYQQFLGFKVFLKS